MAPPFRASRAPTYARRPSDVAGPDGAGVGDVEPWGRDAAGRRPELAGHAHAGDERPSRSIPRSSRTARKLAIAPRGASRGRGCCTQTRGSV